MSMRDAMLRLLGQEASAQELHLCTDELFGVRPGASLAARGEAYPGSEYGSRDKPYCMVADGVAVIHIGGILSKRQNIYRWLGMSAQATTPEITSAIDAAANDPSVRGTLLCEDSPGGLVFGTLEASQAVARHAATKPIHVYGRDEFASCAYWIGCQANRITVNAVAHVGAIGIYSILLDASKLADMSGLRFHVISTGEFKGAGVLPEAGITPAQLAYFQQQTEDVNEHFLAAVAAGRGMKPKAVAALADGRCFIGQKAVDAGLADAVGTYEEALAGIIAASGVQATPRPEEPAPPELEPPDESETPPEIPEEEAMSEKKETPELGAEELGLFRKFVGLFKGEQAASGEAEKAAAAAAPVPLTEEQIDARIEAKVTARVQAQEVESDLAALAGKVPPSVLADAETRAMLLEAKAKSPESYRKRLAIVAGNDRSELFGEAIADEAHAGEARITSEHQAMLERNGIDPERQKTLNRRYSIQ